MSESFDYLERRAGPQRRWHDQRAALNKRWFYGLEVVTLLAGAAIPLVILSPGNDKDPARMLPAILGGVVVAAAAVSKLFKFHENWLQYRTLVEALAREEELFLAQAGDYADGDAARRERLFVERFENFLTASTSQFISTHRTERNGDGDTDDHLNSSTPAN